MYIAESQAFALENERNGKTIPKKSKFHKLFIELKLHYAIIAVRKGRIYIRNMIEAEYAALCVMARGSLWKAKRAPGT